MADLNKQHDEKDLIEKENPKQLNPAEQVQNSEIPKDPTTIGPLPLETSEIDIKNDELKIKSPNNTNKAKEQYVLHHSIVDVENDNYEYESGNKTTSQPKTGHPITELELPMEVEMIDLEEKNKKKIESMQQNQSSAKKIQSQPKTVRFITELDLPEAIDLKEEEKGILKQNKNPTQKPKQVPQPTPLETQGQKSFFTSVLVRNYKKPAPWRPASSHPKDLLEATQTLPKRKR